MLTIRHPPTVSVSTCRLPAAFDVLGHAMLFAFGLQLCLHCWRHQPIWKNMRQIGSSPEVRGNNIIFETTSQISRTYSIHMYTRMCIYIYMIVYESHGHTIKVQSWCIYLHFNGSRDVGECCASWTGTFYMSSYCRIILLFHVIYNLKNHLSESPDSSSVLSKYVLAIPSFLGHFLHPFPVPIHLRSPNQAHHGFGLVCCSWNTIHLDKQMIGASWQVPSFLRSQHANCLVKELTNFGVWI